jgi:hypothetical protein
VFPFCLRHTSIYAEHLVKYDCRQEAMQILLNFMLENFTVKLLNSLTAYINVSASIICNMVSIHNSTKYFESKMCREIKTHVWGAIIHDSYSFMDSWKGIEKTEHNCSSFPNFRHKSNYLVFQSGVLSCIVWETHWYYLTIEQFMLSHKSWI